MSVCCISTLVTRLVMVVPAVPGSTVTWMVSVAEDALRFISVMVVATGLLGMITVILASLETRRREMAVLRSVGARPAHVFGMFMSEAALLALSAALCGLAILYALLAIVRPIASREFGLYLPIGLPTTWDLTLLGAVVIAGFVAGALPAFKAYRLSLADGLSIRV